MILRHLVPFLLVLCTDVMAEFCGNNKIPYGLEVHKDGHLTLLCSRPNCHEKKYADCPERPESTHCEGNDTWVGGLQKTVDGQLSVQCCSYDLLPKYSDVIFDNVVVRRGEFYEGEEKMDKDDDVVAFDLISNIKHSKDAKGEFYSLTIRRYFCAKVPDTAPLWFQEQQWPFFNEELADD